MGVKELTAFERIRCILNLIQRFLKLFSFWCSFIALPSLILVVLSVQFNRSTFFFFFCLLSGSMVVNILACVRTDQKCCRCFGFLTRFWAVLLKYLGIEWNYRDMVSKSLWGRRDGRRHNFGQKFESKEDQKSGGKFYLPMSAYLGLRDSNWSIPAKVWGESEEPVIEIYTEYKFRE